MFSICRRIRNLLLIGLATIPVLACEVASTSPVAPQPSASTTAGCDFNWEIYNGPNGCNYDASDLQSNYMTAWYTMHDIYLEHGITPGAASEITGYTFLDPADGEVPLEPIYIAPSDSNAGFHLDFSGTGPEIREYPTHIEGGVGVEGGITTWIAAGACVGLTMVATANMDEYEQRANEYLQNPNPETSRTASRAAWKAIGSSVAAAAACGTALISLGSPI